MRFLNKRGSWEDTSLYVLLALALVAAFYFSVFSRINAVLKDSSYQKIYYSRDLALLVDSLHASNGDFSVKYDLMLREDMPLDIDLVSDKVIVTDRSDRPVSERPQTSFVFGRSAYIDIISESIHKTLLEFSVIGHANNITFYFPQQDIKLN